MDLAKIRPLDFRDKLDDLESQAITVRKSRNNGLVRVGAGVAAGLGTLIGGATLLILVLKTMMLWPVWLSLPIFALGFLAAFFAAMAVCGRYLEPSERKLLPMLLEPQANEFLDDNWARRDRLLAEAEAFNDALKAFRALPERTGEDEIDAGVMANLAERRARIQSEIDAYLADFGAATAEERKRVAAANVPRKKHVNLHRQSLRDFKRKVKQLAALERILDGLPGSVAGGMTVDLSPYQAAERFRAELEEERTILIRCGLRPKKLPKRRTGRKFLTSGA